MQSSLIRANQEAAEKLCLKYKQLSKLTTGKNKQTNTTVSNFRENKIIQKGKVWFVPWLNWKSCEIIIIR